MHGICSALGQAVNSQIFLGRIEVDKIKATPTVLHCLGFNLSTLPHTLTFLNYNFAALLTPQRFPLKNHNLVTSQIFLFFRIFIHITLRKSKPLKDFLILKKVNLRSCSLYGGFQIHTSMNCTTRIL